VNRLFLDSNVLFTAAHNPDGKAALVIGLAADGCWRVASSEHAIEEARRNLARKYPQALEQFAVILGPVRRVRQPAPLIAGEGGYQVVARSRAQLPPKDQLILDAALGCRATHLLTGDVRHFGPLMNRPDATQGLVIQTVGDFLADWVSGEDLTR
jgi:uncharacterized protein